MNKYLLKIASKKEKPEGLKPHQEKALRKLEETGGVVLDHSVGSGKSKIFLTAVERALKANKTGRALIVAPASLQTNVGDEIKKHGLDIDLSRVDVRSYQKAVNDSESLRKNKYLIAVLDEAHGMRETNTLRHKSLSDIVTGADQRLLATATSAYNKPSDIAPLVNMAAGIKVLPTDRKAFDKRFIRTDVDQPSLIRSLLNSTKPENSHLKNTKELKQTLSTYIDHYDLHDDPSAADKFPTKIEKTIHVPMSTEQVTMYKYLEGKLPYLLKLKVRNNLPLDKKEAASLNSFSTGIRQASNSLRPFMPKYEGTTPKITTAVDNLEKMHKSDKNYRGVVYSNYLDAGLHDYSNELTKRGIKHTLYTGKLSRKEKDAAIEEYNTGKNKVLLISSSGAEGLNLKGTKHMQILEPHFNHSKIKQIMGRGVRYNSHAHLPKEERVVQVEHYLSTFPESRFSFGKQQHSIDSYLKHNSMNKSEVTDQMQDLIKEKN